MISFSLRNCAIIAALLASASASNEQSDLRTVDVTTETGFHNIASPVSSSPVSSSPVSSSPIASPVSSSPVPSSVASSVASQVPSSAASSVASPVPSSVPTTLPCQNDPDVNFLINNNHGFQDCLWFAANPSLHDEFCGWDSNPDFYCQETCDSCWYWKFVYSNYYNEVVCEDSTNQFWASDREGWQDCTWFASEPNAQAELCGWDNDADFECQATCDSCGYWQNL